MVSLTNNLSETVDEKIGDLNAIAQTIQPLLRQEMVSLMVSMKKSMIYYYCSDRAAISNTGNGVSCDQFVW